jgi:hypothetical protein
MDMVETRREGLYCIQVPQDMVQWCAGLNIEMNLSVPRKAGNFLTSWRIICFSTRIISHLVAIIC